MKIVQITGMTAKNIQQYMPTMSQMPFDAMLGERRQAIYELQGKGIIRNDIPPEERAPGIMMQDTVVTPLGKSLCNYYLTAYQFPHKKPAANESQ